MGLSASVIVRWLTAFDSRCPRFIDFIIQMISIILVINLCLVIKNIKDHVIRNFNEIVKNIIVKYIDKLVIYL